MEISHLFLRQLSGAAELVLESRLLEPVLVRELLQTGHVAGPLAGDVLRA